MTPQIKDAGKRRQERKAPGKTAEKKAAEKKTEEPKAEPPPVPEQVPEEPAEESEPEVESFPEPLLSGESAGPSMGVEAVSTSRKVAAARWSPSASAWSLGLGQSHDDFFT